jgi:hypothetical protein
MRRFHILSEGFVSTNVRAMLFPLIVYRRELLQRGIEWKVFTRADNAMFDCDILAIESNFHGKGWLRDTASILKEFAVYAERSNSLFYLDTSDSTALLHPEVLPYVDRYFKGQLLADRAQYKQTHYGRRLYTDFSNQTFGINDNHPENSIPIRADDHLAKLGVWWNSSIADWSSAGRYRMELFAKIPFAPILAFPKTFADAHTPRQNDVSCRMGVSYARETVSWHRKMAKEQLARWAPSNRVSYRKYIHELQSSKIVVSPFGWGEINYKDYETFLAGALLVKPDMSHLETWPDLYRPHETYCPYQWNTEDLTDVIENLLSNPTQACEVAAQGQDIYRNYITGRTAVDKFCQRVESFIN